MLLGNYCSVQFGKSLLQQSAVLEQRGGGREIAGQAGVFGANPCDPQRVGPTPFEVVETHDGVDHPHQQIEALGALGGLSRDALHAQASAALDALVHVRRGAGGGRYVSEIAMLRSGADGLVRAVSALVCDESGDARRGPGYPALRALIG